MGLAPSGYIVKGIMPDRGVGLIYGPSTVGKTFVELDLAAHIAEGREWFGHRVRQRPVAILILEGTGGASPLA
jgi:RecA-family ATPase